MLKDKNLYSVIVFLLLIQMLFTCLYEISPGQPVDIKYTSDHKEYYQCKYSELMVVR